ncbi:MAG: T9SS type A sorting domain-containing protein [Phaeodactylibacter sp.]|uniref:T9SS type A sorting domain-containing protein n=1 Tax=Phaeodactylibacter sp. TaxID=1940289 RepID=UPI0032EB3F88
MSNTYTVLGLLLPLVIAIGACTPQEQSTAYEEKESGAALAMEEWARVRSYPDGEIHMANLSVAHEAQHAVIGFRDNAAEWEALGPKNFGGRTLCLAFHPDNAGIIYAGSASGGLWKSTTAGAGAEAWERIPLGHPVLGVSSIAINPEDPEEMYIGTGEVYNYTVAMPGVSNRLTRGSYGMGILKTTDGGQTWVKSLDWSYEEMRGVWDVIINPENTNTIWATTTQGTYRSTDAGQSWALVHDFPMGMDLELHPADTSILFATYGGYESPQAGIFRSTDGGGSFQPLSGLPNDYSGKAMLSISPSNPDLIYISLADAFESRGLYKSENGGDSWDLVNTDDIARFQGWYSHDVAIKPDDPNTIIYTGVDLFKSTNGGLTVEQKGYWFNWFFGQTPVGGPEGPSDYVHADIHAAYYSPFDNNTVFVATDGGVFVSDDNGESWSGRNGGYQTQQFYAKFSSSLTNPDLAIGGLQDNATAVYLGDDSWYRVIGGDGMCTAIDPIDNSRVYGSFQRLNIRQSLNGGLDFSPLPISSLGTEVTNFNGPFILSPQDPATIYAGAQRLHRSNNFGTSWSATSTGLVDSEFGNPILTIAAAPYDPGLLLVATAPLQGGTAKVLRSTDGGASWGPVGGLPDRVFMEITFDPSTPGTVYAVCSGFGTDHAFKSENGGLTWASISEGLPDIPANSIVVDPEQPSDLYVGNDLGVYASFDYGQTWEWYSDGIADATMAMHLSIAAGRKLRVATHGLGVYETDLRELVSTQEPLASSLQLLQAFPNPASSTVTVPFELGVPADITLQVYHSNGQLIATLLSGRYAAGAHQAAADVSTWASGHYAVVLNSKPVNGQAVRKVSSLMVAH